MLLHLDKEQMLELWRLHRCHLPALTGGILERFDNLDSASWLQSEIDSWYARLLLEAPVEWLKVSDVADGCKLPPVPAADGSTPFTLPASALRVVSVRLSSWSRPARLVIDPSDDEIRMQLHPFTRADAAAPVALLSGRDMRLYPAAQLADRLSLLCVCREDGVYDFSHAALASVHPAETSGPEFTI